jgi:hypothetical protein
VEGQQRVPNLLDMDSSAETRFLTVVALESNAMLLIVDAVGRNRRMMTDLLRDEGCFAESIIPLAQEQLTKEWVQGFLLGTKFLGARTVLLLESVQQPLQDHK